LADPAETLMWNDGFELGDTIAEVEAQVAVWLKALVASHELVEHNTSIAKQSGKWRASSAMQKAIRRGLTDIAERMAWGLHALDHEYLWRRLPVVAVEDIGVANIPLVAAVLWVSGKVKWREQNGGEVKILQALVRAMANSVKDRSVCDLVVWVDSCPDFAEKRATMEPFIGNTFSMWQDETEFLADRMLAGWSLAGTLSHRGDNVPEIAGSITSLLHYCGKFPTVVQAIMRWGSTKFGDAMPIAFPLIWEMVANSGGLGAPPVNGLCKLHVVPDALVTMPMIGTNYPSAAFDWHCAEGKRALSYFNAACPPMADFLTECGIANETQDDKKARRLATSSLLFRVEGSQVDRRLVYDGSRDLFDLAELALNRSCGIRGDLNDWGMALMKANMPMMHHARLVVMDAFPAGKKVKSPDSVYVNHTGDTMWVDHAPGHTDLMVSPEAIDEALDGASADMPGCFDALAGLQLTAPKNLAQFTDNVATDNLAKVKKKLVIKSKPKGGSNA
jgi:hypothetical protein